MLITESEKIRKKYEAFFNLDEVRNSKLLIFLYFGILFSFFTTFNVWISRDHMTVSNFILGKHVCPPYFLDCGKYYFLEVLPFGYSQTYLYVILFLILGYGVYQAIHKNWIEAHFSMMVLLFWKIFTIYIFTYGVGGNFDYYDMILAFIWLFIPLKKYFAKLSFVYFYFLASTIKIHESWIFGNYLNSFLAGAPFFSDATLPIFTNIVILMQIVGCWYLLSNKLILNRLAYYYFMLFHIYSGIIVYYRYITISIVALFILFHERENFKIEGINKKSIYGYLILLFLLIGQSIAIFIPGDQKITLEGNYYGLYMFESNHQCISRGEIFYKNSTSTKVVITENNISNYRCDPYMFWFVIQIECNRNENVEKISWTFDHSINGHPYKRIIDQENMCPLKYKIFGHNEWINENGPIQDIPVYKNSISKKVPDEIQIPTNPIVNDNLLLILEKIYSFLWVLVFIFILYKLTLATIKQKE